MDWRIVATAPIGLAIGRIYLEFWPRASAVDCMILVAATGGFAYIIWTGPTDQERAERKQRKADRPAMLAKMRETYPGQFDNVR